jgi:predicted DNA-binding transcriptional regulator AlpA
VRLTLQRFMDEEDAPMRLGYDLEDDDDGAEPWALGDDDPDLLDPVCREDGVGEAERWLDERLGRLSPAYGSDEGVGRPVEPGDEALSATPTGGGGEVVLRRSAPTRPPRRRRADPDAALDLPSAVVPGYVRDRRGTWRYAVTGQAVPGARDLTPRSLYRFPVSRGHILVPIELVRSEPELAWCMAWKQTLTTALLGGRVATVLRIPVGEWERRADIPTGLWAPELTASRLLGVADVAGIAGVTPATITAYLSRQRIPPPVTRIGNSPVWSRPVIRQWLADRPGQGRRTGA